MAEMRSDRLGWARLTAIAAPVVIAVPGLIYLMGVELLWKLGQPGGLRYADAVPTPGSAAGYVVGGLWLLAAVLFVAAAVLLMAGRATWRMTALAGVVVSVPVIAGGEMVMKPPARAQVISADAAAAVCSGLRVALWRAMVPAIPCALHSGARTKRLSGSAAACPEGCSEDDQESARPASSTAGHASEQTSSSSPPSARARRPGVRGRGPPARSSA
jgi:hypothetical protein